MAGWAILVVEIIVFELLFQKFERYKPKIFTTGFDWNMLLLSEVLISNSKKSYWDLSSRYLKKI